ALLAPSDGNGLGFLNGGSVTFDSNQGVTLASGSAIDVSSGGAILANRKTQGGKGGSVSLTVNDLGTRGSALALAGELRGYGVSGGGPLTISAPSVLIGDNVAATAASQLVLPTSFFSKGFSNYDITGVSGLTVAANSDVEVTVPVYRFTAASYDAASGRDP